MSRSRAWHVRRRSMAGECDAEPDHVEPGRRLTERGSAVGRVYQRWPPAGSLARHQVVVHRLAQQTVPEDNVPADPPQHVHVNALTQRDIDPVGSEPGRFDENRRIKSAAVSVRMEDS